MEEDKKYFLNINKENVGPLSFDDVATHLKNGVLTGDNHIFVVGDKDWVYIKNLEEFSTTLLEIPDKEKKSWYIHKDGQDIGPLSKDELLNMFYHGDIDSSDYAWRRGLDNWLMLQELEELSLTPVPPEKDPALERILALDKKA